MPWTPVDVKPYTPVAQPVWSGHVDGFLACKPGISMPGLHALFFVDYSRYMVSS